MSQEQLESLLRQEQELRAKLTEIEGKRKSLEAYEKAASEAWQEYEVRENGVPVLVESFNTSNGDVRISTPIYNSIYVGISRNIPTRRYAGDAVNLYHVNHLESLLDALESSGQKFSIAYNDGAKEAIKLYLEAPRLSIALNDTKTKVILTVHKGETFLARQIQGAKVDAHKDGIYTIGISELPTIYEKLKAEDSISWSDEAKELLEKELSRRTDLDSIALADDYPAKVTLNDITLRPFQRKSIGWLEHNNFNGLIAHQMGLGKTPISIAAALTLKEHKPNAKFLIICPAGLKTNWTREVMRFTGQTPFHLSGRIPTSYHMQGLIKGGHTWYIINYDVLSSRVETSKEHKMADGRTIKADVQEKYVWAEVFNLLDFDIIIFDEVHYIKNVDALRTKASRKLEAAHYIALTGTPVLNRPGEIWPILNILAPEKFPSYEGFLYQYTWDGKEAKNVSQLRDMLKTLMLRYTKKEVMKDLPPINRIYEWHELSVEALVHYKRVLEGVYTLLAAWNPEAAGSQLQVNNILVQILRLKQICAMDKVEAIADLATQLSDADENGGKVLIFSQFKAVVHEVARRLGNEAVEYHGDKSGQERKVIYDNFLSDKAAKFFVATWQTAGEGLNLQCANNVIFADLFWTPANHQQAEERAYGRLADPHPINSYYVVTEGTIEDWLQEILARKLKVIEQVVEGLDTERQKSVQNELLRKMKQHLGRGL